MVGEFGGCRFLEGWWLWVRDLVEGVLLLVCRFTVLLAFAIWKVWCALCFGFIVTPGFWLV